MASPLWYAKIGIWIRMMRISHIITGLNTGGAEMMLYKLLGSMGREDFEQEVISLTDIGLVGAKIQTFGVRVRALGMRRGVPNPLAVLKLAGWLRRSRPVVIQTWMYHADLIGGVAAKLAGGVPVAWGIRHSNLDPQGNKCSTIWTARVCAKLSRYLPARIVCCSEASRRVHTALGYTAGKMVVIPNGFDLDLFRPDITARLTVRQELGIPDNALLIGLVARFDPQKDHGNFVEAAAMLHRQKPTTHFLLCGDGVDWDNNLLAQWIDAAGLRSHFHLLGRGQDISRLTAALDIASSSSSFGEGFPNVIGEAMACGVPSVVTDVGDSAMIVRDTGGVVPPRDPAALAEAWRDLIDQGEDVRLRLGEAARRRIEENFSLPIIAGYYENLYREMVL